jgi:signal transduction histidine kinase
VAPTTETEILGVLLDEAADGILLADPHGHVLLANRRFRELADLLGLDLGGRFADGLGGLAERATEPYAHAAAVDRLRGEAGEIEFEDAVTGRIFRLDASPDLALGRAWTLREVTQQREREREREERVAAIGHDLRTPLTSMAGFIGLLREGDYGPLNPEQQRYLEIVHRAAGRLQQLIDELLAASGREVSRSKEAQ